MNFGQNKCQSSACDLSFFLKKRQNKTGAEHLSTRQFLYLKFFTCTTLCQQQRTSNPLPCDSNLNSLLLSYPELSSSHFSFRPRFEWFDSCCCDRSQSIFLLTHYIKVRESIIHWAGFLRFVFIYCKFIFFLENVSNFEVNK